MKLTFHGGAKTVTGSCILLQINKLRILIDCGLWQGSEEIESRNWLPFGFPPSKIDYVILTHAHLDHCGLIPRLVREGFAGEILCTEPTRDLTRLILADSAQLHEEEAALLNKKERRRGGGPIRPLYDLEEVLASLDRFADPIPLNKTIDLAPGVKLQLRDAGHVLGAAFVQLRVTEGRKRPKRLLFSGDLGNTDKLLTPDPAEPEPADLVVLESTYGERAHRSMRDSIAELRQAILLTFARGGNVLIPSSALERSQELLAVLFQLYKRKEFPGCQVFLDSPLAISATKVFRRYSEYLKPDEVQALAQSPNAFDFPALRFVRSSAESKVINSISSHAIIIAGSGMCTGGRILHHLKHQLWRPECSVVFVGYQAEGTLGRRLIEGARTVRIFGEEIAVRAQIWTINGFSAHADQPGLLRWLSHAQKPAQIFLVHGEMPSLMALKQAIHAKLGWTAHIADWKETVEI
ncbi:MAG: MBL fold metallo-hydrolase [Candidatus Bipolaricaulota bacterium]|nr:MBL fold metallo-hydrolase [Candidatus Bipolaricaulota bacterium]MDW8030523.1 MBL fold metallo-hydrolase [Candidatus Bipolaricaulota bacterium]